ncbi:S-layer homology domain-containing protein [Ureibacillus manganicus]|uniref:SLH domain-containing protein n=1 Tax=Ureibacillus manganicus DSM 26584 TaxID=1384049 RepID=A0A0A3I6N7_9BACL|nr:S-layer homology domain-containing protein [Ureibacillus manganicus]KGR80374.1 hypothetical protein CD29_00325 [Ureibacillus manganicus DSM 26584]
MFKKFIVIFFVLIVFSFPLTYEQTSAQSIFPDAKGHWAEDAIDYLYENDIVKGLPNGDFGVKDSIKRRDAAIMIALAKGLDTKNISSENPFSDINPNSYYYNYVIAAVNAGYINGYPGGKFNPNGELTRQEMAVILVEAYDFENLGGPVFKDVSVNAWSYDYIQTIISNKITSGISSTQYGPLKNITRSEFALMLARAEDERFREQYIDIDDSFSSIPSEADFVIQNYSPQIYEILDSVSQNEGKTVEQLIAVWEQEENLFGTINMAVHEIIHSYQLKDLFTYKDGSYYYNFNHRVNNQKYALSHLKERIYPSSLMGKTIPKNLQTFRFETYISPEANRNMASIQNGAYGILVEYEAYYIGDHAAYQSYDYLKTLPFNRSNWLDYYTSLDGTAYYEFTYFILNYLKYAKTNEPDVYNYVMSDNRFKTVFKNVYTNYKTLIEDLHPKRVNEILQDLSNMGIDAEFRDPYLIINGSGKGLSIDSSLLNVKNELKKSEYQNILSELLK